MNLERKEWRGAAVYTMANSTHIRLFAGDLRDAQGLIEVDAETFQQCDCTPEQLIDLLAPPEQWVAVAVDGPQVVGYVSAFETDSLVGRRWEVDELAVRPDYQRRGLGTQLVAAAVERGAALGLGQARALVAETNAASRRAFEKVDFRVERSADLLLYEVGGRVPRPAREGYVSVREARPDDSAAMAAYGGWPRRDVARLLDRPGSIYLLAEEEGRIVGCLELIEVQTLQYRGFWAESIAGRSGSDIGMLDVFTGKALSSEAIEATKRRPSLELVGRVAATDTVEYRCFVSEGFRRIDTYRVYVRPLGDVWHWRGS